MVTMSHVLSEDKTTVEPENSGTLPEEKKSLNGESAVLHDCNCCPKCRIRSNKSDLKTAGTAKKEKKKCKFGHKNKTKCVTKCDE